MKKEKKIKYMNVFEFIVFGKINLLVNGRYLVNIFCKVLFFYLNLFL